MSGTATSRSPFVDRLLQQLAGAGLGDRADVGDDLVAAHADAGVVDGQRARLGIGLEANLVVVALGRQIGSVIASKRSRSRASEALEISSRRKISLLV